MYQIKETKYSFLEYILIDVKPSWQEILIQIFNSKQGNELIKFIQEELQKYPNTRSLYLLSDVF